MKVAVECYSGRKADERPLRFRLEGRQYSVEAVLDQWDDPESIFYKVRANDGNLYILRQQTSTPHGEWDLISFLETKWTGHALKSGPLPQRAGEVSCAERIGAPSAISSSTVSYIRVNCPRESTCD